MTDTLNDIPQEEIKVEHSISKKDIKNEEAYHIYNNFKNYYILLFTENDEIVGITNGIVNKKYPFNAKQFMTGVKRNYRSNGYSKWLKALFIRTIMKDEDITTPTTITTGTNISNIPIIKLSKSIGMKQTSVRKEYLLYRE